MQESTTSAPVEVVKQNRIVSFLKTLRNNWKKTTFGLVLLGFGYDYALDKYKTQQFMRAYCEEARKYGEQPLPLSIKPRHVTVILNPAAKNGKGKKLYEKFSSPLLNLAGLKVSLILTEQEGQARQLMEVMDNTDAVIVAGGDGTLHEVVTGLLRREDEATACQRLPLGIVPIGKKNNFAKTFFSEPGTTEPRLLAESTMAVIRELQRPVNIMKVEGSSGKPVYAVKTLECGAFRDADTLIDKYWYYGPLKTKFAYLMAALKGVPNNLRLAVSYALPCQGCNHCYISQPDKSKDQKAQSSRWWHAFIPRSPSKAIGTAPEVDYSKVVNEECGVMHHQEIPCSNFSFTTCQDARKKSIEADFENPLNGRTNYIQEGFVRHSDPERKAPESLEFREMQVKILSQETEERWFSIENEKYEMQDLRVTILPLKLNMYVQKMTN